jgi:TrmH family RNA methyltransferase
MSDECITSPQNQWFKRLLKLRESRERKATGLTRIDGARELMRALDADLPIEILVVCRERARSEATRQAIARAEARSRPALIVDEKLYERLRYGDRDEGICAATRWRPQALTQITLGENPLLLVLEGVEKPGNLGAVLRTADAAGADAVLLCDSAIDPSNPNAVRASLGALFTLPVVQTSTADAIAYLAEGKITVFSAIVDAAQIYTDRDLRGPTALALGSEQAGLSEAWRGAGLAPLRIPMRGKADSLNVSVAAALLLYEAVRQRTA